MGGPGNQRSDHPDACDPSLKKDRLVPMPLKEVLDLIKPVGGNQKIFAVLGDKAASQPATQVETDIVAEDAPDCREANHITEVQMARSLVGVGIKGRDD